MGWGCPDHLSRELISGESGPSDKEGGGGGHPDPEKRGGPVPKKHFFGPSDLSLV